MRHRLLGWWWRWSVTLSQSTRVTVQLVVVFVIVVVSMRVSTRRCAVRGDWPWSTSQWLPAGRRTLSLMMSSSPPTEPSRSVALTGWRCDTPWYGVGSTGRLQAEAAACPQWMTVVVVACRDVGRSSGVDDQPAAGWVMLTVTRRCCVQSCVTNARSECSDVITQHSRHSRPPPARKQRRLMFKLINCLKLHKNKRTTWDRKLRWCT